MGKAFLACLAVFSMRAAMPLALGAEDAYSSNKPMLLSVYYVWYRTGGHPRFPWSNWTRPEAESNPLALQDRRPGEPPLSCALCPLIGLYDSGDPEIARWHVRLAQAAGIDAFLASWWGDFKERDRAFESGILAAAEELDFKIALLDERAQFHHDFAAYQAMLAAALAKYKDSPAYLRIDGRPVVYLYQIGKDPGLSAEEFPALRGAVEAKVGPVYWIVDKLAHDPDAQREGDEDRIKKIPEDWLAVAGVDAFGFYSTFSRFRASHYEELAGKYSCIASQAHGAGRKMLLPVHPGHDTSRFRSDPYIMPRRDGQTLRDYLRAAADAKADFTLVTSWNEWPEGTVVEPSSSWADPYAYLKILAEWKGVSFVEPPLPEGLRR